jgi:hypothetical protein
MIRIGDSNHSNRQAVAEFGNIEEAIRKPSLGWLISPAYIEAAHSKRPPSGIQIIRQETM